MNASENGYFRVVSVDDSAVRTVGSAALFKTHPVKNPLLGNEGLSLLSRSRQDKKGGIIE